MVTQIISVGGQYKCGAQPISECQAGRAQDQAYATLKQLDSCDMNGNESSKTFVKRNTAEVTRNTPGVGSNMRALTLLSGVLFTALQGMT